MGLWGAIGLATICIIGIVWTLNKVISPPNYRSYTPTKEEHDLYIYKIYQRRLRDKNIKLDRSDVEWVAKCEDIYGQKAREIKNDVYNEVGG